MQINNDRNKKVLQNSIGFFVKVFQCKLKHLISDKIMENYEVMRSMDLFNNDLYEFTCSYGYFMQKKHEQTATFDIFFRKYPFKGQYVIFAGLQSVKTFIKNLKFTFHHEHYLKGVFPQMKNQFFQWLTQDFSQKVTFRGMKEGEIVFANEPILSYTGPLGFVQLFESPCLNLLGFASLVSTNASRIVKAAENRKCMEFGTRRAQGPDGALSAAQYAYLGGFMGTSNVECARKLKIPCLGTMSHAYVTSFSSLDEINPYNENSLKLKQTVIQKRNYFGFKTHEGELASFLNFAIAFPDNFTTLIDTYSTIDSGLLNTIIVGMALIEQGITKIGIRLDSGDLSAQSKKCRKLWTKYVPDVKLTIIASDDLYEERLIEMVKDKCEIDIFAIGTNIATCKKQPALGVVCKLVQLDKVPKMKLSSVPEKATYPCVKNIYRIVTEYKQKFDLISLQNQILQENIQVEVGTIKEPTLVVKKIKTIRLLNDKIDMTPISINQSKAYVQKSRNQLSQKLFDLVSPSSYVVYMTQKYLKVFHQTHALASSFVNQSKKIFKIPFQQIIPLNQ